MGKILPMPIQILQITADADSFKKCRYLPMPINRHITSMHAMRFHRLEMRESYPVPISLAVRTQFHDMFLN